MNWEYKFVFKDDRMTKAFFDLIQGQDKLADYECRLKEKKTNLDYYFDSPDLKLESQGMVCRARRIENKDEYELVLKRQGLGPNREVVYPQTDPVRLNSRELKELHPGNLPQDWESHIKGLAETPELRPVMVLKVLRQVVGLYDAAGELACLNLDEIEAYHPETMEKAATDFEIELKSNRELFPESDYLSDFLRNAFGLIPITRSKLRRLSRVIRHRQEGPIRKIILDMDTGVDDALAILLAMNSPEIEVLGITAVGGNVDIQQTVLNTAAVLSHLRPRIADRYPTLPPVARGSP